MDAVLSLAPTVGIQAACDHLAVARASFYRHRPVHGPLAVRLEQATVPSIRARSPRALGADERARVLDVLHEERFQDRAPAAIQATLLDEGQYLCSTRTMYRILQQAGELHERRPQLVHPHYRKPELLATAPNQLWSWDITKLRGPVKWTYFYLYVILDVFSRYVTGWLVADRESAELATRLIEGTVRKHEVPPGQLNIHADRGRVMISKPVAFLMSDLGVTKTHSRPYVSDDNPYSESQFRTLKYRPGFPDRFGCLQDARAERGRSGPWSASAAPARFLSTVLRLVQRRTSPLPCRAGSAADRARCRLLRSPGTLRPPAAHHLAVAFGGLDQQAPEE